MSEPETPPVVPVTPPAPTFVPTEEFKAFQATMTGTLETMKQTLEGLHAVLAARGSEPPAPLAVTVPTITREQFTAAVAEGNAAVIDAYMEQGRRQDRAEFDTRMAQLE